MDEESNDSSSDSDSDYDEPPGLRPLAPPSAFRLARRRARYGVSDAYGINEEQLWKIDGRKA